ASVRQSCLPRLRAPPVTSATLPSMPRFTDRSTGPRSSRRILAALELGGALGEERLDALAGVLRLERGQEGADLDLDGLIDRRVDAIVDGLDDEPRGDGRPLAQRAGQRLRVVQRLPVLRQAIDEPDAVALGRGDLGAEDQMLERQAASDQAGKALRAPVAGRDAEVRLGLPHPRALLEDADVAPHRDLASAAEGVA